MIQKIKPSLTERKEFPTSLVWGEDQDWNCFWALLFVGFVPEATRQSLQEQIQTRLNSFRRSIHDPHATFPFSLRPGQTRASRFLEEVLKEVKLSFEKNINYYQPAFLDLFAVGFEGVSQRPAWAVGTVPVLLTAEEDTWVGEHYLNQFWWRSLSEQNWRTQQTLSLPDPTDSRKSIPLFRWENVGDLLEEARVDSLVEELSVDFEPENQ